MQKELAYAINKLNSVEQNYLSTTASTAAQNCFNN